MHFFTTYIDPCNSPSLSASTHWTILTAVINDFDGPSDRPMTGISARFPSSGAAGERYLT